MDRPFRSLWFSLSRCWILQAHQGQPGFLPTVLLRALLSYISGYKDTKGASWLVQLPSWDMPSQVDLLCGSGTWTRSTTRRISPLIFASGVYASSPRKLPSGAQRLRGARIVRTQMRHNESQSLSVTPMPRHQHSCSNIDCLVRKTLLL